MMRGLADLMPKALRVLVAPAVTFKEVATQRRGFGGMPVWLAVEFLLVHSVSVARLLRLIPAKPAAGLMSLWSMYVRYALPPMVVVFVLGIGLYYSLRLRHGRRLDLWAAASVLAYAWPPHVLMIGAGVSWAYFWGDHPLLPQHSFWIAAGSLSAGQQLLQTLIGFAPSLALCVVAVRTLHQSNELEVPNMLAFPSQRQPWLALVGTLSLGVVGGAGFVSGQRAAERWEHVRPVLAGDPAPDITLLSVGGEQTRLSSLRGKVVLVDFWATWCPPCVAAMPHLKALRKEMADQDFALVSVNTEPHNIPAVRDFARKHGLSFPVYIDAGIAQRRFRVHSLPTLFLIDRHGVVRRVHIGTTDFEQLRETVLELLRES